MRKRLLKLWILLCLLVGAFTVAASATEVVASGDNVERTIPMDPIRLQLPTVRADMFDMILDPYGMIPYMNAAWLGGNGERFAQSGMYFLTPDSDGTYRLTDTSEKLTVINKSRPPVGMDVTLWVNLGGNAVTFVDSAGTLKDTDGAAMYLALHGGGETKAVIGSAGEAVRAARVTLSGEKADAVIVSSGSAAYPDVTFQWARDTGEAIRTAFLDKADNTEIAVTVTSSGGAGAVRIAASPIDGYQTAVKPEIIPHTARDRNVTVSYTTSGGEPVAAAYFAVAAGAAGLYENSDIVTTLTLHSDGILAYDGQASLRKTIAGVPEAYKLVWDDDDGYVWDFTETGAYDSFSFYLTGNINDSPAWNSYCNEITLDLVWEVFAVA